MFLVTNENMGLCLYITAVPNSKIDTGTDLPNLVYLLAQTHMGLVIYSKTTLKLLPKGSNIKTYKRLV